MSEVDFIILGGVTVRAWPAAAAARPSEQRELLLGRLLLEPGARVTTDALVDALWGDEARADPRNGVQQAVRSLRGLLGDTDPPFRVVVREGDGYRLVVDPLRIDAVRFARLAARGGELLGLRPLAARAMLAEALSTWRGPLLGEHAGRPWAASYASELDSIRDGAEHDLNEARLALGEHVELERELRRQIRAHPQDERRRAQLVRALDGAGRNAEAMMAYRSAVRDLGGAGAMLRGIGETVARGGPPPRSAAVPAAQQVPGKATPRSDSGLLCALLGDAGRAPLDPGIGTATLLVDEHGGEPHPVSADRLIAAFADPDAALRAASALAAHGRLRAAIAVHCGGVVHGAAGPAGPGPVHCWQLAAAAHPGQVLVSDAARRATAVADPLLRNLGGQRFADLRGREPVFELERSRRASSFPPLASLDRVPHNLPVQHTGFVGRRDAVSELSRLVGGGELVTLTGPGGCGKTRLALQVAADQVPAFAHGAWFVALAELPARAGVERVAAATIHELGVRPLPAETVVESLTRHLSDRVALLVLDNCEHVHEACAELSAVLRASSPGVCLLATSRRPLRTSGERVWPVPPLGLVPNGASGLRGPSDAVMLLLERAGLRLASGSLDAEILACCERICRAVDGLPLAIELAASQVPTRGLAAVAGEVEEAMRGDTPIDLLVNPDPRQPARQRTLDAAVDWSYRLLSAEEQLVLRRLAVFRGGFGTAEAQSVAGGDELAAAAVRRIVASLVETSMVARAFGEEGVARMRLIEPIRAFALGQLENAGEHERVRTAHAAAFAALAARAAPELFGAREQAWLERLESEHDNLRSALAWYVDRGCASAALRLVGALWWLWFSHGHLDEGSYWVRRALAIGGDPSRERVRALRAGSHLAWWQGDYTRTAEHNAALAQCADAICDDWGRAWAPMADGAVALFQDPQHALALFEVSKRRFDALGRRWEAGYALQLIGGARWYAADEQAAGGAFQEAVEIFEQLGHPSVLASVRRSAGLMAAYCGHVARGVTLCTAALRLSDSLGDRAGSAQALNYLAAISRDQGDLDTALARHAEALGLAREAGELGATCWALDGIAGVARATGEPEIAARLLAHSGRLAARAGYRQPPREQELRTHDIAVLRAELDPQEFERASAEGELMSVGEAVSCALAFTAR